MDVPRQLAYRRIRKGCVVGYSPVLALVTGIYEVAIAVWALRGTGERRVLRVTALILALLGTYQFLEVLICANPAAAGFLPRLAFITVTWLPPLGLVLIARLSRPQLRTFHVSATCMLAAGAGMVLWILADQSFATASVCSAVYARYAHVAPRFMIYGVFYWLGLFGMVALSGYGILRSEDAHQKQLLQQVFYGTVGFVLPSVVISHFAPATRGALPSIMCHFALILALFLTRLVLLERRDEEEPQHTPIAQPH